MKKMKKSMWLILMFLATLSSQAQVVEGFEGNSFPPTGWSWYGPSSGFGLNTLVSHQGNNSVRFGWLTGTVALTTPVIAPDATNHTLSFWVKKMSLASSDDINGESIVVKISTTDYDETSFSTTLLTIDRSQISTTFAEKTVDLASYIGQNIIISISFNGVNGNIFYVDDVTLPNLYVPSCPMPTALNATPSPTTASLSWTQSGSASVWTVEYGEYGFTQGTGTTVTGVTTPSYVMNALAQNTSYQYYIQADCGGGETSEWAGPSSFTTTTSCPPPMDLDASNLTTTTAQLNWIAGGLETTWYIEYGPAGFAQGAGTIMPTNANLYTIAGLTASTNYEFYVKAVCGANDESLWSGPYLFTTSCLGNYNLPYVENFDGNSSPDLLQCITVTNNNADGELWQNIGFTYNSGPSSFGLFKNSSLAKNDWFFTPGLNLEAGKTYRLNFYYKGGSVTYPYSEKLEVKYGASAAATAMTSTAIFNQTNIKSLVFIPSTNTFTVPANGVYYVGFHAYSDLGADDYIAVDDISITEDVIPTCPVPSGLAATNVTYTTAVLGWTSTIADVNIRYRELLGSYPWTTTTVSSSTLSLSTLTENLQYEFQVQAICSLEETSDWSPSSIFQTPSTTICAVPTNLSAMNITETSAKLTWSSSVPNINVRYRAMGTSLWINVNAYVNCIVNQLTPHTGYEYQVQARCSTTPGDTSDWSPIATFQTLEHTCFAPTNLTVTNITETTATLGWTSDASNFKVNYRMVGESNWTEATAPVNYLVLSALTAGTDYEFIVYAICSGTTGDTSEWTAISPFTTTSPVVACDAPSALVVSAIDAFGASLNWTAGGSETTWNIRYKKVADASYTEVNNITTKPYVLVALQSSTAYVWNVQAVCSVTLTSTWSAENTFTTTVGVEDNSLSNFSIYCCRNQINVINNGKVLVKEVVVYDMIGQEVGVYAINSTDNILINTIVATGNYVVKIVTDAQVMTKKLIIN